MAATMAEVAERAGVSITTVSHVVNKTRNVAPATQELVLRAMASTGYRHNLAARALATQSTDTIGLAMSIVTNPYFADLVRGIERQLRSAGFTLVIADTNDDSEVQRDVLEHLMGRRVSGLIVSPLEGDPALDDMLRSLLEEDFPLLMVDRRSNLPCDQVHSESTESVAALTAHLAEHGHTRIAYVTGSLTSMSARDRLAGHQQAVRDLGLDDDPSLVIDGQSDEARAEEQMTRHLDGGHRATAIVVGNNQMTLGTLRALQSRQLRIPQDVAVVCYDDFEWADLFSPRLTAVAQDAAVLASRAVDLLLARIADPLRDTERVVVPTAFRHRDSCGC